MPSQTVAARTPKCLIGFGAQFSLNFSMLPWADSAAIPPATDSLAARMTMAFAGTLKNMRVACTVAPGAGASMIFTVRLNGVSSALT